MEAITLFMIDGPRSFKPKDIRRTGSTLDNMKLDDGSYVFYDRSRGHIDVMKAKTTGVFVSHPEGIMFAATEVWRERYDGVL